MPDIRVSVVNKVDPNMIRVENVDGEPHLIIPSWTLPNDVVMNSMLYPRTEIDRAWPTINNTLAPIGHPANSEGEWVSAYSPVGIHNFHGGAYNRNARRDGHRVYVEKVVNIRYAQQTEPGKRLLDAVRYNAETGQAEGPLAPIHTSTGLLLQQEEAPAGAPYKWIARNMRLDHDAILLDEPGAATPEQGVGLMVNCSTAVNLSEDNNETRRVALRDAVRARFGDNSYVVAFDNGQVVFEQGDIYYQADYTFENMVVSLSVDAPVVVQRRTSWVEKIANLWKAAVSSKAPITTNQPGEEDSMPLSKEDLEAIGQLVGNALTPITERLDKHGEELTSLKTNSDALAEQVKTNAEKQLTADRALVAGKHGETIANALTADKITEIANALRAGDGSESLPEGERQQNNATDEQWGQVPTVGGK